MCELQPEMVFMSMEGTETESLRPGWREVGVRAEDIVALWYQARPPAAPRSPVITTNRQVHCPLAVPVQCACASVVYVSVCLSASLNREPSQGWWWLRQLPGPGV